LIYPLEIYGYTELMSLLIQLGLMATQMLLGMK